MKNGFNLAARPFVNRRPWRRLTAVLWALGTTLLAFNAVLYWGYLTGSAMAPNWTDWPRSSRASMCSPRTARSRS